MYKIKTFAVIASGLFAISCATAPKTNDTKTETPVIKSELQPEAAVEEVKKPSELEIAKDIWDGVVLSVTQSPSEITKGRNFDKPYIVSVSKNGSPLADTEIAVSYPSARNCDDVKYEETVLKTDATGTVSFLPPQPSSTFYSEVVFTPKTDSTNEEVLSLVKGKSVKAPFRVKTNLMRSGGSIAIVDFNTKNAPIVSNTVSSSKLLMALMNLGFKGIGNADFTNAIVSGNDKRVYTEAKELFGNAYSFLIFGTVKYATPITKEHINGKDLYSVTLTGELAAFNMKTGELYIKTKREVTSTDAKEWNVLPMARDALANEFAEAVVYGL